MKKVALFSPFYPLPYQTTKDNPMTTPTHPTTHTLAVEAAKAIKDATMGKCVDPTIIPIIEELALEPVIRAGEALADAARNAECRCDWGEATCLRCEALAQWRTLTAPPESNLMPLEGSRSDQNT